MVKINLRMNLSHFLNKSYEKDVMNKLFEIHNDKILFYLKLWYEDGSVVTSDLKRFLMEYESKLHYKTIIKVGNELKPKINPEAIQQKQKKSPTYNRWATLAGTTKTK